MAFGRELSNNVQCTTAESLSRLQAITAVIEREYEAAPTVCPSAAPPPIDREHAGSGSMFQKSDDLADAQRRRLHPTITAGRDSPPDDRPPFSRTCVWRRPVITMGGWAAIGSGDPIGKDIIVLRMFQAMDGFADRFHDQYR